MEPDRVVLERSELDLPRSRAGDRPLRIGVIADLQFERLGSHEREAVERLQAERPDVILMAGDYHQGSARSFRRKRPALRALLRSLGKARSVMAGTGVRLLVNEVERVRVPIAS